MYSLPSSPSNRVDLAEDFQQGRSPLSLLSILSERSPQQPTVPALPPNLDKLISEPWSPEANRQIDQFLWYTQQEFELVEGAS